MASLAFLGSPEPAATCLAALVGAAHEIVVVVTEPDRRRGRGSALVATPVKKLADELGLEVSHRTEDAAASRAELGVVVAFGRIIRSDVLERLPMVNAHFSLLPRWRGAAPVERAILAGDAVTGVSLMAVEHGLDTGPVYASVTAPILPHESAASLTGRLSTMAADLLVQRLAGGLAGLGEPVPQEGEVSNAAKISPDERRIDWALPAEHVERRVRVGRAYTTFRRRRLLVHEAVTADVRLPPPSVRPGTIVGLRVATGDGWLELRVVQAEGRQPRPAGDWRRGARILDGESFG